MFELKICSFNCCSLRKNIDLIRSLTDGCTDIIFLQETFVTEDKLGILDFIDENYECIGVPAKYSEKSLTANAGRPEGGMAILWKKGSQFTINKIILDDNFIVFNIRIGDFNVVLVNVYMNSDIWEISTLNKYLYSLSLLEDILRDMEFHSVYFVGDFNADPHSGRAWRNLSNFMMRNSLKCFDVDSLSPDTCTFVGYGNSQSRWLDHLIGKSFDGSICIKNICILDEVNGSDHLPLQFFLEFKNLKVGENLDVPSTRNVHQSFVNWEKLKPEEIERINSIIDSKLGTLLDHPSIHCDEIGCRDKNHLLAIDNLYSSLCNIMRESTEIYSEQHIKKDEFKDINTCEPPI